MAPRLPPLNSLRLFEAAGRHLSFKEAAQELQITRSAVSHGIQSLEDWLGVALFARSGRGLALTPAGAEYLTAVRETLTILAAAGDSVPGRAARRSLAISVAPTFGARVLLPIIHRFRKLNTGIEVRIDTSHHLAEFPRDGVDLAIRLGHGVWPKLAAVRLLAEELVPVCAPKLLAKLGPSPDLSAAPLIHLTTVSQDWDAWAKAAGRSLADCRGALMVDTIHMVIDAAVQGLGIALGRRPIIDSELENGSLVRFCGPSVVSATNYWLVGTPEAMSQPNIIAFRDWLLAEMSEWTEKIGSSGSVEKVEQLAGGGEPA